MAFVLPVFNITVNIWHAAAVPPVGAPALSPLANLCAPKRNPSDKVFPNPHMILLLPALTDVRSIALAGVQDVIEAPAGSARYYRVAFVDDVAKGFANEHRFALLEQVGLWPTPIP